MTKALRLALRRLLFVPALAAALLVSGAAHAAVISAGTPTTSVPIYLTVTLGTNQFLLPVQISGATGLQNWQFDVTFDNTEVQAVDPNDGTSGIYGAQFTAGDADSLSFILGGLPSNALGLVDDVAGFHPNLIGGATGDGLLAFILFELVDPEQTKPPSFGIENAVIQQQAPEPGTVLLMVAALLMLGWMQRNRRDWRSRLQAR